MKRYPIPSLTELLIFIYNRDIIRTKKTNYPKQETQAQSFKTSKPKDSHSKTKTQKPKFNCAPIDLAYYVQKVALFMSFMHN